MEENPDPGGGPILRCADVRGPEPAIQLSKSDNCQPLSYSADKLPWVLSMQYVCYANGTRGRRRPIMPPTSLTAVTARTIVTIQLQNAANDP